MTICQTRQGLTRRLALYSAALGGAAVSTGAMAVPVPIDPGAIGQASVLTSGSDTFMVDVDGNGVDDFELSVSDSGSGAFSSILQGIYDGVSDYLGRTYLATGVPQVGCSGEYYAGNLAPGTLVGPGLGGDVSTAPGFAYYAHILSDYAGDGACGFFSSGVPGYVGIKFERNGNTHYGYLQIQVTRGSTTLEILGGAYESQADTGISIQQAHNGAGVTAVPVGGAIPIALSVLAMGAAALRRRKRDLH